MKLSELSEYLDGYLRVAEVPDYPPALNGLQVENSGRVSRIAAAVDATRRTIDAAAERGADLLLVHHGLFWDGNRPVTGRRYRRLKLAFDAGLAVYASHLPLDVHPEVGNNAVLARELGIEPEGRFGEYQGCPLGVWGRLETGREQLTSRLAELLGGRVKVVPGGPELMRTVGVITGGAGGEVRAAREAGLDGFITGEGAHHHYFDAEEDGVNLFLGGHYATEVWGVKRLAAHLEEEFGLPWSFLDFPTGL
ncbi:MAG: Nif3-like dinuclear metal center hexameric protein [Longimicrobiaceae bacterium]